MDALNPPRLAPPFATPHSVGLAHTRLAYGIVGQGAPPIVALHGYMASGADFGPTFATLSARRACLALDLPGHGASRPLDDPGLHGLAAFARLVVEALPLLHDGPVVLLGHSLGGMIALRAALAAPERVAGLVLVATSARPIRPSPALVDSTPDALRDRALANAARTDVAVARVLRDALAAEPSVVGALGTIRAPTLCVVGRADPQFVAHTGEIAMYVPHADLEIMPGVAHQPHLEAPEAFAARVARFLDARVPGRA